MKVTFLLFLGGMMMLSSSASATTVTCQAVLTGSALFTQLEATNGTGGCDIGNVNFDAFNFNTTSSTFSASDIDVSLDGGAGSSFGAIVGLTYSGSGGTFPGGGAGDTSSIGYTATFDPNASTDGAGGVACPVNYTCGVAGAESQLNSILGNGAIVTTVDTGGFSGTSHVDAATLGDETNQFTFPMIVAPIGITKVSTYNGLGTINTFSTEVIAGDVSNIPEPATFSLIGGGLLLGLGMFRRKRLFRS